MEQRKRPCGGGWVHIHRDEVDGPVFSHPELWRLWCWCLLRANHKKRSLAVKTGRGETVVTLQPGQFLFGRNAAGKALGTPARTVADRMSKLERLGRIAMQPATHFTVVTVCDWASYGGADAASRQPITHQPPDNHPPTATNKNEKNALEWRENVDHVCTSLKREGCKNEPQDDRSPGPIADPSWQRTYGRARDFAKKAKLPKASPDQKAFWLKVSRLVDLGQIPEGLMADGVAGLLAGGDEVRDPWAYLYGILRTNARDGHSMDLEARLAGVSVPPSILNRLPAKRHARPATQVD